jgi:hypothetical protein
MNFLNQVQTMEVYVQKEIQAFEYVTFTEFKNEDELYFCCEKLKKYVSIVNAWSSKIGKFCIVEKDVLSPIDYCPFCGEKIEYISVA